MAEGVLAYLRDLDVKKNKGRDKSRSAPLLEVASFIVKTNIDEDEQQGWNVLLQADHVLPWRLVV